MPSLVAAFSDTHFNSTVALCPPTITLDDGGTYRASKAQLWLWQCWLDYWQTVARLQAVLNGTLYAISVGDLVDGDHHDTPQIITRNESDQHKITVAGLKPMLDLNPKYLFFVRGTEAHVGKSGKWEEMVARDLGAVEDTETGTASWWWLPMEIEGVTFDIAHHGRLGGRPWTEAGGTINLAAEIIIDYVEDGQMPPKVVLRADRHKKGDSGDNLSTRVLQLPSWQLQTGFGNKLKPGKLLPIGGYIFICENGAYEVVKKIYRPQRRTPWRESS
jgi:hypothetical protein